MSSVARLKVTLDEVEPKVTRRLEFRFRGVEYGIPDPDWEHRCIDARHTSLGRAIKDSQALSFKYLYDFGDGWTHTVKVEKIEPAIPGLDYPLLLHASGRCPPEDVGGPFGYSEFLEILADRDHPEYDQNLVWAGGSFDPQFVDLEAIDRKLGDLKRRGSRAAR